LSIGSLAISKTRSPPAKTPAQAVPIQSQIHDMVSGSSSRSMESGMPDYGFGRCDGHHKMIDFKLEKGNGTAASWISVCGECGDLRAGCAGVVWRRCRATSCLSPPLSLPAQLVG
jgi:hypothetical protein